MSENILDDPAETFWDSLFWRRSKIVVALLLIGIGLGGGWIWWQDAELRRAEQLLADEKPQAALDVLSVWQKAHGTTDASQAIQARCLIAMGRYQEGVQIFESIGAVDTEEMHAWAIGLLHLEQWGQALPLLEKVREKKPDSPDLLHEIAAAQSKLGMNEEALETIAEFKKYEKFAHRAALLEGTVYQQMSNNEMAAKAWSEVEKHDPDFQDLQLPGEEFLAQFGSLQLDLGNPQRAKVILDRSLAMNETAEAHFQAGRAEDLLGNGDAAEQHWKRTVELDAHHLNARESLAQKELTRGNGEQVILLLQPIVDYGKPRSATTYLMERASLLTGDHDGVRKWRERTAQLRQLEQMNQTIAQLLRENPNSYWGQVVRSYDFARHGNRSQASAIINEMAPEQAEHPFVAKLRKSLADETELPPLDELPFSSF